MMPDPIPAPRIVVDPALAAPLPVAMRHRFIFHLAEASGLLRLRIRESSFPGIPAPEEDAQDGVAMAFEGDLPALIGEHPWALLGETPAGEALVLLEGILNTRPLVLRLGAYGDTAVVTDAPVLRRSVTAKCLDPFPMAGRAIEILPEGDPTQVIARVILGDTHVAGSDALHEGAVEIPIPPTAGEHRFTLRPALADDDPAMSWNEVTIRVERVTAPLLPLRLTVRETGTGAPLADVHVRSGRWSTRTDAEGCARLDLPAGPVRVGFWRSGYTIEDLAQDHPQAEDLSIDAAPIPPEPLPWEH